jgi:hypothetical protein
LVKRPHQAAVSARTAKPSTRTSMTRTASAADLSRWERPPSSRSSSSSGWCYG